MNVFVFVMRPRVYSLFKSSLCVIKPIQLILGNIIKILPYTQRANPCLPLLTCSLGWMKPSLFPFSIQPDEAFTDYRNDVDKFVSGLFELLVGRVSLGDPNFGTGIIW